MEGKTSEADEDGLVDEASMEKTGERTKQDQEQRPQPGIWGQKDLPERIYIGTVAVHSSCRSNRVNGKGGGVQWCSGAG